MNPEGENNCSADDDSVTKARKDPIDSGDRFRFLNEDYFDNWWSSLGSRVEKISFGEQENEIVKYSHTLKSFRSEFETDSLLSTASVKLIQEGKIDFTQKPKASRYEKPFEVFVPGYNLNSFIPNTSSFTFKEMVVCQSIIKAGGPKTHEEIKFWAINHPKLIEEQNVYMTLAEEQWRSDNFRKLAFIKKEVKVLIDQFWKVRLERVLTLPKFYHTVEDIALKVSSTEQEVNVKFIKTLDSIGRPARIFIPDLWTFYVNVNSVISRINSPPDGWSKLDVPCYKQINQKLIDKGYHSDVSQDKVCETLARENNVNIVMSSSAFSHLVNINDEKNDSLWNLPFTVHEYQTDRGIQKIVFIDKKLPPLSMTALDRNKYYAKLALKKLFISVPINYRDQCNGIYDADSVETFGVESPSKGKTFRSLRKRKKIKCAYCKLQNEARDVKTDSATTLLPDLNETESPKKTENVSCDADDSNDSDDFCIDLGDEDNIAGISHVQKENSNEPDLGAGIKCNKLGSGVKTSEQEFDAAVGSPKNSVSPHFCCCTYEWVEDRNDSETNKQKMKKKLNYQVVYNLWEFTSPDSHNYMSKNCSKDLKVLIRTTLEGQVIEAATKQDEPSRKIYKLSPKLEYQTEFGAEQVSLNEIVKEWTSLYIRPASTLARVRIDGVSGELIQIQMLNLSDLAAECSRLYKVNLKSRLASVHNILVKLSGLSAGKYMLSHTAKQGNFVALLRSVETGGHQNINIHLKYSLVDPSFTANQRSPFPLLDTTIQTPTHEYFKRIPCTFVPRRSRGKQSLLKDNSAINPPVTLTKRKKKKRKMENRKKRNNGRPTDHILETTVEKC